MVLAKGEAGKEILYPVALVVLGGLTTSTLMDVALRPTIFFNFARKEAMRVSQVIMHKRDSMRDDASRSTSLMDTRHP